MVIVTDVIWPVPSELASPVAVSPVGDASNVTGILSAFVAFILGMIYAYFKIKGIINFPIGNPTIVILILFIGGIQLFSIGILGMYIGQIFDQVKNRPLYIIEKTFDIKSKNNYLWYK